MSWFARSIANTLKFDDDDDDDDVANTHQKSEPKQPENPDSQKLGSVSPESSPRGVKEDLSELSKTLTRQFWGVASFLAPPPQPDQKADPDEPEPERGSAMGIRGDFAEIGGKFRSGISRLSNNINVSEITKMASNFLQLESDEETDESRKSSGMGLSNEGAIGVTEEVVAFARDISMHPETWLDFPLPENVGDDEDFDMSDAQQEHALAVEQLAPSLAALRFELCPRFLSEGSFWKIYFVLLHPKLDKEDAVLLSTPQVLEARALLTHELKNRKTIKPDDLSGKESSSLQETSISHRDEVLAVPPPVSTENNGGKKSNLNTGSSTALAASDIGTYTEDRNEIETVDKSVIIEENVHPGNYQHFKSVALNAAGTKDEDDTDDWLNEETTEVGATAGKTIPIENDEDVSFSDLEEDDGDAPTSYRKSNYSSDKDSRDWVQLGKSSSESSKDIDVKHSDEENAWLDLDDIEVS